MVMYLQQYVVIRCNTAQGIDTLSPLIYVTPIETVVSPQSSKNDFVRTPINVCAAG